MKRAALSEESLKSTPPLNFELFATTPTPIPPRRMNEVTISLANSALCSSTLPSSAIASITTLMSNGSFSLVGMTWRRSGGDALPVSAAMAGFSR
jgi:hypothetical protein